MNSRRRTCALGLAGIVVAGAMCAAQQPAVQSSATAGVVEGYTVSVGDPAQIAAQLQQRFQLRGDVRIAADANSRKIVAIAPADVQQEIGRWLAQHGAAPQAGPAAAHDAAAGQALHEPRSSQQLALANISWKDLEERLFRIWGSRLSAATNEAGDVARFEIQSASGQTTLEVDRRRGQVTINAPGDTAGSWLKVLQAIDAVPLAQGEESQIVPLDKADPATVVRAISLIRTATGPDLLSRGARNRKRHIGQFVGMIFQPEGGAAQPAAQPPGPPQPAEGQPEVPPAGEPQPGVETIEGAAVIGGGDGPLGNVTIEIVGDVLVVRGRRRDVDRVLAIIEEIERQSVETRPEVELYPLQHVDAAALSEVIQLILTDAFSYQGRVTVTPLNRPNALLLVGRKESIPAVIELIQKLDRPTPPDTQIRVFQLEHMSSIDAERTVRQFFVARPGFGTDPRTGLGTRVLAMAEFRSNSLIVQASPRDLAEVAQLLDKLDVVSAEAKSEVRVFKLRNSTAEELAPVLQEAITGQGAQGQQQQQQQQQQGAGGQTATPAQATRLAISLQLLRIGPEGQQLLQSGILENMRISADTRSNSLIVVGPSSSMDLMGELIRQLDELPASEALIKVFTIVNGDATALAETLQELFGTQAAGGGGQGGLVGLQTATGGGDSSLVPLRFSVDQRTNSILVSGTAGDLNVIYTILSRLDEGNIRQRITEVYRLHNAPAADVALALNTLLTSQRDLNQATPELVSPFEQIEREVIVVPEIVTNSLIVSATPRYYLVIKRIITELDRRPPMVAIQVMIAEVLLTDFDEFGIELGLQDSLLFDRGIVGGPRFQFASGVPGNDNTAASLATRNALAGQAISDFSLGRANGDLGFGGLTLSASSESVSILIRALQQSERIQVISRPQVQTLDNQPAFIQVGSLVPRITSTTITNGISQSNTTDANVGIILGVTPRTSPDGTIVMEVNAEKSEVGPDATGIPISIAPDGSVIRSPQIFITTAQTTVSAKSGQTVILGGLITKNQGETTRRVPYLGDIPVLGRLFRFDAVSDERRELLIILTPYILQNEEQNEWLNMRETERMSWCIADVVNIHGPVGVGGNEAFNMQASEVIFPDVEPSAPQPTPAPAPRGMPTDPLIVPPQGFGLTLPPPAQSAALPTGVASPIGSSLRRAGGPPAEMPARGERSFSPPAIQSVAPPSGTQARLEPQVPPQFQFQAPPPGAVAPAGYQQPATYPQTATPPWPPPR
ncbi:MAG: secretin N-terminal domain-containing protein [Pirellulaceae bacterium]